MQGRIIDLTEEGALVQAVKDGRKVTTSFDRLYPAEDNDAKEVDDNCGLMYLNEATLLNNIRLRYQTQHLWYLIVYMQTGIRDAANFMRPTSLEGGG